MIESLISLIENLQVEFVIGAFAIYFVLLWILIPVWVFIDAKRKYTTIYAPVLLFLLILPLNLPAFIFYIIIRPDNDSENFIDGDDQHIVNIPIANFVGEKQDLVMGIDLRIHNSLLKNGSTPDFKLSISTNEETVKLVEEKTEVPVEEKVEKEKGKSLLGKMKEKFASLRSEYKDLTVKEEIEEDENEAKVEAADSEDKTKETTVSK